MKHYHNYRLTVIGNNKGLTLTEVMVSGIIGAVIAGMLISVMSMQNSALNEGTANSRLLMQANTVSEEIGRRVRSANLILQNNETWSAVFPTATAANNIQLIRLFNASGTLVKAYQISGNSLQESSDGTNWTNFKTGAFNATVSGGGFNLSADRKAVALNLPLTHTLKGTTYTCYLQGDHYRCRN